jgi:hypothetical protein
MRRITERSELSRLQGLGGYVVNVRGSRARIHRVSCATVRLMNPDRRGGVYHSQSLKEIVGWLDNESMASSPCRICLSILTYRPKPEKLINHIE